jgi:hypothetical protein
MQITLTVHGEELLREALARHPGKSPAEILEQALAEHAAQEEPGPPNPVREQLKKIPGATLPEHWPPKFQKFEPLCLAREPVSEQLIRERR